MDEIRFTCPVSGHHYLYSLVRFRRKYPLTVEDMDYYFTVMTFDVLKDGRLAIRSMEDYCRENGSLSTGDLVVVPKEDTDKFKDYVIKWHSQWTSGSVVSDLYDLLQD